MFDDEAVETIRKYLLEKEETIAVAESVTSGFLQAALSSANDAIRFYQGGLTAYNLGQKTRLLHIDPISAQSCNCVSQKLATDMALNAAKLFIGQWGIGITGYATAVPESGNEVYAYYAIVHHGKPVGGKKIDGIEGDAVKVQLHYTNTILKQLAAVVL
jgi:nicotinamide-nucleotide amidase